MEKVSQRLALFNFLATHPNKWFVSYKLHNFATPWGYVGDEGKRRCRELVKAGLIERTSGHDLYEHDLIEKEDRRYSFFRFAE
jgi:hypothetical protein